MLANTNKESKSSTKFFIIMAMSTAILLVSPVLVLMGLGYVVDSIFHAHPFYMIVGGILGFISGIMNVFRMTKLIQKRKKTDKASVL